MGLKGKRGRIFSRTSVRGPCAEARMRLSRWAEQGSSTKSHPTLAYPTSAQSPTNISKLPRVWTRIHFMPCSCMKFSRFLKGVHQNILVQVLALSRWNPDRLYSRSTPRGFNYLGRFGLPGFQFFMLCNVATKTRRGWTRLERSNEAMKRGSSPGITPW